MLRAGLQFNYINKTYFKCTIAKFPSAVSNVKINLAKNIFKNQDERRTFCVTLPWPTRFWNAYSSPTHPARGYKIDADVGEAPGKRSWAERTLRLHIAPLPYKGQLFYTLLVVMEWIHWPQCYSLHTERPTFSYRQKDACEWGEKLNCSQNYLIFLDIYSSILIPEISNL